MRITISMINKTTDIESLELLADNLTEKALDIIWSNQIIHRNNKYMSLENRMDIIIKKLKKTESNHSCVHSTNALWFWDSL